MARPRETLEPLLLALGLPWHPDCLEFHARGDRVRTASLAQARQPLYRASAGRWRHYESQLQPWLAALAAIEA